MKIDNWEVEDLGYEIPTYDSKGKPFKAKVYRLIKKRKLSYCIIDKDLIDQKEDPEKFCQDELKYHISELIRG